MSKLNTNLLNLDRKQAFVAKGDFLSVITKFSTVNNTLVCNKSYLTRVSRFNQEDFQNFIKRKLPHYDITLLSSDIFYDKYVHNDFDYINKQEDFVNFKLISKLFGDFRTIDLVVIDFEKIKIIEYKDNQSKIKLVYQINKVSDSDPAIKINNFLFDPFVGSLSKDNLQIVRRAVNDLVGDMIIFVGEYIWTGKFNWIIQNVLNNYNVNNKFVIVDHLGIYEALLKDDGVDSNLKFLNKDFFVIDYFFSKKGSFDLKDYTGSDLILKEPSNYDKYDIRVYCNRGSRPIYFKKKDLYVNQIILYANPVKIMKYSFEKRVNHLLREDFVLDKNPKKDQIKEKFKLSFKKRIGVKLFDYFDEDILDKITVEVISRQKVRKGDRLARYNQAINLLEKRFFSPITGKVNLDYIKFGYIFIESEDAITVDFISLCSFIIRPKIIIGEEFRGLLNENIIYVSFLDKEVFDKYLKLGVSAFIARSISKEIFFDIERFNLNKIATIAIIDGIDIKVKDDKQLIAQIPSSNVVVDFMLDKNYLKFYTDLNYFELDFYSKTDLKNGDDIKIIHDRYWGESVNLVRTCSKGNILKINHPFLSKIEKINLL